MQGLKVFTLCYCMTEVWGESFPCVCPRSKGDTRQEWLFIVPGSAVSFVAIGGKWLTQISRSDKCPCLPRVGAFALSADELARSRIIVNDRLVGDGKDGVLTRRSC